jgi:hypothetical protein
MNEPMPLTSADPRLDALDFKPYRNVVERRVTPFLPTEDEPQTMQLTTSWGSILTVKRGDMLVSEIDAPQDVWPVDAKIFDETYVVTAPGYCIKRAITHLVPLTDLTKDEDRMVTVHSLEGPETVRAGDFYLARGVKGEIWSYPKQKVQQVMRPVE